MDFFIGLALVIDLATGEPVDYSVGVFPSHEVCETQSQVFEIQVESQYIGYDLVYTCIPADTLQG